MYSSYKKLKDSLKRLIIKAGNIQKKEIITMGTEEIINSKGWDIENDLVFLDELSDDFMKRIENNLRLMNLILDYISYGVLIIDNQRRIVRINKSLTNLFYLDKDTIIGNKTIMVFNNKRFENLISRALSRLIFQRENIIFFGDEDVYLDIEAIPITADGSIIEKKVLSKKIDNKKEINLLILAKNTTQEVEFSKLRSNFVANVSHEMRTPLTSIKGYLETLTQGDLGQLERVKNYLAKSLKEVNRLNILIEDVLDLSRIEYRRNVLFGENYNLVDIISDCINSLCFLANQNNIEIEFNYETNPIKYTTDEELFRQMVKNIIENSIFYAGEGSKAKVKIKENKKNIILDFIDNGAGINKRDTPYIFQRFFRGRNPYSSRKIGSGLGLSIVKHIVELHNGKIGVSSLPGFETRFNIILPK